jgi:hypothetical protein
MVQILSVLLVFFVATATSDYVLVRYSVNERASIVAATLFGVLCAIFLSALLAVLH